MNTVTTNIMIVAGVGIALIILLAILSKRKQLVMAMTIDVGGEKRLEIITNAKWRETEIKLDGSHVATLTKNELYSGYDLKLTDGSILNIKLAKHVLQPDRIQITVNGQSIAPVLTRFDNERVINNAAGMVYMIAAINLIFGVISLFVKIEAFAQLKLGWQNIIFGLVYLILGFFTHRRSALALILFILIFGFDSFPFIILSFLTLNSLVIGVLLVRVAFLAAAFIALGEIYNRKNKAISKAGYYVGSGLLIVVLLVFCVGTSWAALNAVSSVKQLFSAYPNLLPHPATMSAPKTMSSSDSCRLKIKDTAESVNMRDKADSSTGKVVDYLARNDLASVLGNDGGTAGNEWWFIEVVHDGKIIQGWVTSKWVEFENGATCSGMQQIATPFP